MEAWKGAVNVAVCVCWVTVVSEMAEVPPLLMSQTELKPQEPKRD